MEVTQLIATGGHEQVTYFADASVGLRAVIAIHSTALGPSLGGIRFWHYEREEDALADVLRLSAAMTKKAAVVGLHQGGGKAVVLWDATGRPRSQEFLTVFGRAVHSLGGRYIAAEDVGATQADMDGLARETPWVTGVDPARGGSGDPSPVTAWGVMHGMRGACERAYGSPELAELRVVVQGAGHVGAHLARLLVERGALVAVSDVDGAKVARLAGELSCDVLPPQHAIEADCDILAPCALGGVLTTAVVPQLKCTVICGAANNQLADDAVADALAARGIVYAPDYVVNAGGIINIAQEWAPGGYSAERACAEAARIEETTVRVLDLAAEENISPARAADELAARRIAAESGGWYAPGDPSEMRDALIERWKRFR